MAVIYTEHFAQFFDANGNPLSGGKLYAYSAGTTTPKATYTTAAATVENAHPIVLDSAGRATLFIEGSYRFDLYDANDVLIESTDNITSFTTFGDTGDPFFQTFSGNGSQTVFTLSEALGTDSKNLMVFVDAGGSEGYEIRNPSSYTLSGTSLTFGTAPASGTDNIYVFAPSKLLGEAAASAAAAASSEAAAAASEGAAATSETNAAASATLALGYASRYKGTSTTSLAIGTGSKAFTTQADKFFDVGVFVLATSDADETNYMWGQVTAYSGTSLTVNVIVISGSGTHADWTITVSGARGAPGAPVSPGSITATELADGAVTTAKILDANVTTAKILDANITTAKLVDGAVTNAKLNNSAITGQTEAVVATGDSILFSDVNDSGNLKRDTVQGILDLVAPSQTKAWVNFQGTGTVTIRDSYNVSSITDNGTGNYTVNLSVTMANNDYSAVAQAGRTASTLGSQMAVPLDDMTTTSFKVVSNGTGGTSPFDVDLICVTVAGDLA